MHILFLGVTKTITFKIQDWAVAKQKFAALGMALQLESRKLESLRLAAG